MGAAKEIRDRKHFREMFDQESKERGSDADRTALIENQWRQIERLRQQLADAKALADEMASYYEMALRVAADQQRRHDRIHLTLSEDRARLTRENMELHERLAKPRMFAYEAMLLASDGDLMLIHPGFGHLATFQNMKDARIWAVDHDGYIKARKDCHSFHGPYHRVGFNIWPSRS